MIQRQDEAQDFQTPPQCLDLVRQVFGGQIGLDPCTVSSNPTGAGTFYTPAEDGLTCSWHMWQTIFMNPPYGRGIGDWTNRLAFHALPPDVSAIALLPVRTDTKWWQRDVSSANAVCFWAGRIRFVDPKTGLVLPGAGKFPSAFVYWGPNAARFREVFGKMGWIP